MSKEAMKLALEGTANYIDALGGDSRKYRQALAEQPAQQQEPVVWMYVNKSTHETKFQKHMRNFIDHSLWSEVPLYGEPLANHELQCICGAIWLGDEMVHLPDKRLPPQRTWVGLTFEEVREIFQKMFDVHADWPDFADAIEAKLKEKNSDRI